MRMLDTVTVIETHISDHQIKAVGGETPLCLCHAIGFDNLITLALQLA